MIVFWDMKIAISTPIENSKRSITVIIITFIFGDKRLAIIVTSKRKLIKRMEAVPISQNDAVCQKFLAP